MGERLTDERVREIAGYPTDPEKIVISDEEPAIWRRHLILVALAREVLDLRSRLAAVPDGTREKDDDGLRRLLPKPGRYNLRPDVQTWTPAEQAIGHAMRVVGGMGASPELTDAEVLLGYARNKVAEHVIAAGVAPDGTREAAGEREEGEWVFVATGADAIGPVARISKAHLLELLAPEDPNDASSSAGALGHPAVEGVA